MIADGLPLREGLLANRSGFLEAEISLLIADRMTDDDVIKHPDLKNPGCFAESAGEAKVGFARARVAGRMVKLCGARSYVQCAGELPVLEAFYRVCLTLLLHKDLAAFGMARDPAGSRLTSSRICYRLAEIRLGEESA